MRPLSEKQITYALGDVTHLCDIYLHLKADLEKRGRVEWVNQEEQILCNPNTYANDPYKAWERVKIRSPKPQNLAILRELAAWREATAQRKDIPKTWVLRDDALAEMAGQAPQTKKQLAKIRNISKDMAEGRIGEQLLKAIETALASPKADWPSVKKKKQLPQGAVAVVDILKMLLRVISSENEVAPKIIANASDLEEIALHDDADVPALRGWRRDIFGEEALAVKHGRLAIGMKNGKITKFPIHD